LENNVREIAQFLDIKLTEEQITRISKANTFDHKKQEAGKGHVLYRLGNYSNTIIIVFEENYKLFEEKFMLFYYMVLGRGA